MDRGAALEDEFGDVVGKARRGQELDTAAVGAAAGLDPRDVARIEHYEYLPPEPEVVRLAAALGLAPAKLAASARGDWRPAARDGEHASIRVHPLRVGGTYAENAYLAVCRRTGAGLLVDPGADAEGLLETIAAAGARLQLILLTHGHADHVGALHAVVEHTRAPALVHGDDLELLGPLASVVSGRLAADARLQWGEQTVVVRHTPGHTAGSVCLVHAEAAFVGDTLFAGSVGGTRTRGCYRSLLGSVGEHLLTLPPQVVLYPGHGPATTVGEERAANPFFL